MATIYTLLQYREQLHMPHFPTSCSDLVTQTSAVTVKLKQIFYFNIRIYFYIAKLGDKSHHATLC
jgi:hypothetical protein